MEKKRTAGAMAGAALAAAVVGEIIRRNGYAVNIRLRRVIHAEPRAIIDLVRQVEREVELIPAVRKVAVIERSDEEARYRVDGTSPLGPWWVVYTKWWDYEANTVGWASDEGAFGLTQRGRMNLEPVPEGTEVILTAEYTSLLPVVGPAVAAIGRRLLVEPNFTAWLKNIAAVVEAGPAPHAETAP